MYALYHHFLQKVKEDEIQKYNQKHRDYLIRSGKIVDQPILDRKIRRNQNVNNVNYQPARELQRIEQPVITTNVEAKPKRQRQFNRPNQNNQINQSNKVQEPYNIAEEKKLNNDSVRTERRGEFTRPRPARIQEQQELAPNPVEIDRPIKHNKLTQEQIEFLNQKATNQNKKLPGQNKKPQRQEQPVKQIPKKQQLSEYQQVKVTLIECGICGRKFKQQALLKHENICEKVFQQKRKPFQVKIADEQAEMLKKKNEKRNPAKTQKKQDEPKWKNQSEQLRNIAKRARGEKIQNEIVEIDTRIPCPGCGRKFSDTAAAKHIEFCTKKAKKVTKN